MKALANRQGFRFNKYTSIRYDDFSPDNVHKSSNITDVVLYVRVQKDETGRVYAFDGTLHCVSMLRGSVRQGYVKSVRDDTKCPGYYHTARIGPMRAAEMVGGHDLAKEFSPVVETADGDRLEWSNWHDFAKMLPRFKVRYVG